MCCQGYFCSCTLLCTYHCWILVAVLSPSHSVLWDSTALTPLHFHLVCVQQLQRSLNTTYCRCSDKKYVKERSPLLPLPPIIYLQSILCSSRYKINKRNEKLLQKRRMSCTWCKILMPVMSLHMILNEQVDHGAEPSPSLDLEMQRCFSCAQGCRFSADLFCEGQKNGENL